MAAAAASAARRNVPPRLPNTPLPRLPGSGIPADDEKRYFIDANSKSTHTLNAGTSPTTGHAQARPYTEEDYPMDWCDGRTTTADSPTQV